MKFNQTDPGFLRVSVTKESIEFEYFVVPFDDSPIRRFDAFTA
jgi:hypothetical protein